MSNRRDGCKTSSSVFPPGSPIDGGGDDNDAARRFVPLPSYTRQVWDKENKKREREREKKKVVGRTVSGGGAERPAKLFLNVSLLALPLIGQSRWILARKGHRFEICQMRFRNAMHHPLYLLAQAGKQGKNQLESAVQRLTRMYLDKLGICRSDRRVISSRPLSVVGSR